MVGVLLFLSIFCGGCPKDGGTSTSGSSGGSPDTWVVFEVYEAGTGNPLSATVWPVEMPDDFDTIVQGRAGSEVRFAGIGLREGGEYALAFRPGESASVMVWSPGHELKRLDSKLKKGENLLSVELRRTEVEDQRVPERIRLEVLESLPTEGPRTGS
ncbi:MAG: hypothetical protein CL928_16215 [Deltaproteobacteria bacterium]|nr:hypothetical protein [Deltaproteobacteria bacterium]